MKSNFVGIVIFLLAGTPCFGQQSIQAGGHLDRITVRMLNGKNGKPIRHEVPNIWLSNAKYPSNPLAEKGEVTLEIDSTQPREIRVMPNYYVDCRFKGDTIEGLSLKYSVDEIVSKGIVGGNLCGQVHAAPAPGVLVLYVRPRTFWEKWKL